MSEKKNRNTGEQTPPSDSQHQETTPSAEAGNGKPALKWKVCNMPLPQEAIDALTGNARRVAIHRGIVKFPGVTFEGTELGGMVTVEKTGDRYLNPTVEEFVNALMSAL